MGAVEVDEILNDIYNLKGCIYNEEAVSRLRYNLRRMCEYVTLIAYAYDDNYEMFKIFYNDEAIELICINFKYDMSIKEMDKEYYFLMIEDFIKNNGIHMGLNFKKNIRVISDAYYKSIE